MTISLSLLLVSTVIGVYVWWFFQKKFKVWQFSRTLSGPPFLPLVGNVYVLLGKNVTDVLSAVKIFVQNYGHRVSFWIGHDFYYITTDPQELKTVFNHPKCMNKGAAYEDFKIFFDNSIILLPYELWKPRRKVNSRCFKSGVLKSYVPTFYENSVKLVQNLEESQKNINFDLIHAVDKFIFMTFFATSFGVHKEFKEAENLGNICVEVQSYFGKRIVDPFLPVKLWLKIATEGRKVARMVENARRILDTILQFKKEEASYEDFDAESNLPQLDMLMRDKTFDDDAIFQEMALFTAAATDTTGHTLAFGLVILGMIPEIQQKVYEEVMSTVQDRQITVEDIPKLKYTEMVILECLRMFPSIPIIARTIGEDVDLGTNKILPKGSNILISIWHLHRDPAHWKNPDQFDPERFNAENITKIAPYVFLPFSGGPRDCIGKTFAMMEMKITIATVVRALEMKSGHKSSKELADLCISCISLNVSKPLNCQFYKRNTN